MDPFSILGALSGLVKTAQTTIALLEEVQNYPAQFQAMVTELSSLYSILEALQLALNTLSSSSHFQSLLEKGFCPPKCER